MYESKYSKYVRENVNRFAEDDEIKEVMDLIVKNKEGNSGLPVFYDEKGMYVDNTTPHSLVIGPSGCKKTTTAIIPMVKSALRAKDSIIVSDPKQEIFDATAEVASAMHANIYVIRLREGDGAGWNPLSLVYKRYKQGDEKAAETLLSDFITRIVEPTVNKNDIFWANEARSLLIGLGQCLYASVPDERYFNIVNLANLCSNEGYSSLTQLKNGMAADSTARRLLDASLVSANTTRSCIFASAYAALEPFIQNKNLCNILTKDSIDIEKAVRSQSIIYLQYPDEKKGMAAVINAFLSQAHEVAVEMAESNKEHRLPRRLNFILDEFGNLPTVDSFSNRISKARGYNIRYTLCCQNVKQLEEKYGGDYHTIMANCGLWMIYPSRETELLERMSHICGQIYDHNGYKKDLITASELQYLEKTYDYAEVLIIKEGLHPYVTRLKDYRKVDVFDELRAKVLYNWYIGRKHMMDSKYIFSFDDWYDKVIDEEDGFKYPFPK